MKSRCNFLILSLFIWTLSYAQDAAKASDSLNIDSLYRELPELVVKGERPTVKLERGKLVYNMPLLLEKIPADNAYDAVTNIPGIKAADGNLSLAGANVTLIIDGKASTLNQAQAIEKLKNMPASRLSKAEVMLSAPAQYHIRGAAINIITIDYSGQHHISGQLQATLNQSKYTRGHGQGTLLYANGRFTFDLSYTFTCEKKYAEAEHYAQHPLNGTRVAYSDKTGNISRGTSHDIGIELGYRFAENHKIELTYMAKANFINNKNVTTGSSMSAQSSEGHNLLHNIGLYYTLPFGLRLNGTYTYYNSPRDQSLNGRLGTARRVVTAKSDQTIHKWLFSADQTHSLGRGWQLNYGLEWQTTNNNSYQTTLNDTGIVMPEATSKVNINERRFNGYMGFNKQLGEKFSLEATLAIENYHTPQWNDWRVYPTLNAAWQANDNHTLNLAFNSNATYPSYWSTMSHIYYSSAYSEIWGNPLLIPSKDYQASLSWLFRRRYTLMAFASFNNDYAVQLPYQLSNRMAVVMQEVNFNHRNIFGLEAMVQFSAGSWLSGNAYVIGMFTNDKNDHFFNLPFNRSRFTVLAGGNASVLLSKEPNVRFSVSPTFQSKAIQGVYDINDIFSLNVSMRWASANGKWNAVLSGNNLTNRRFVSHSGYANQDFGLRVALDWTTCALSIIYKFGNYKATEKREVDTSRMRK